MKILITGATGFIGFHLARRLADDGHAIVACARQADAWRLRLPAWEWRACDFMRDTHEADWSARVADVDLVINAVGIIGERHGQSFQQVQAEAPQALFSACSHAGVKVIQFSAMGADAPERATPFLASKRVADDHLWQLPGECVLLYPSIVIGEGANSTALFCCLAVLPVVPLPGRGEQILNPIHIDDVCAAVSHLVRHWPGGKQRHWLAGRELLNLRELLAVFREWLELGQARFLPIPLPLLGAAARIGEVVAPDGLLRRDTLHMLMNVSAPTHSLPAAPPRPLRAALWSRPASPGYRRMAMSDNLRPLLLASLAFVWICTGLVSVCWNRPAGYVLLAGAGITGPLATLGIYAGGVADLALGVLLLSGWRRPLVYRLQIGLMLAYLGAASVILPGMWLDPLGSLTKTLPMLALTAMLAAASARKLP